MNFCIIVSINGTILTPKHKAIIVESRYWFSTITTQKTLNFLPKFWGRGWTTLQFLLRMLEPSWKPIKAPAEMSPLKTPVNLVLTWRWLLYGLISLAEVLVIWWILVNFFWIEPGCGVETTNFIYNQIRMVIWNSTKQKPLLGICWLLKRTMNFVSWHDFEPQINQINMIWLFVSTIKIMANWQ